MNPEGGAAAGDWRRHMRAILAGTFLGAVIGGAIHLWRTADTTAPPHPEATKLAAPAPARPAIPPAPARPPAVNSDAAAADPATPRSEATPLRARRLAQPPVSSAASYDPAAAPASGPAAAPDAAAVPAEPLAPAPARQHAAPAPAAEPLTEAERAALARLPDLRKTALAAAERLAAANARDAAAPALAVALRGEARPIAAPDLVGAWRCRSIVFDGTTIIAQAFSRCGIVRKGEAYRLSKIAGAQRKLGTLEVVDEQTLRYAGALDFDPRLARDVGGTASLRRDEVGLLTMPATRRLRLELPTPAGGLEVVELTR